MSSKTGFLVCFFFFLALASGLGHSVDVPSPQEVIGFEPGTDCELADWEMIDKYLRILDAASDRVVLEEIGKSTLGREMLLAVISSAENLARAGEIKAAMRRLADPHRLPRTEALELCESMPMVLFVGCAQHATEIGSTQAALTIAHRLATEDGAEWERVRREVVFLLVPSMNPDGHQMVCDWYNAHLGTPFEGSYMPWLYHHYVGHDINRDWAMLTQAESQHISRVLFDEWFPQIVFDVHQMGRRGARMFIPPYYDPINPNIDPLIAHELTLISAQMRLDLSMAGHTGIVSDAMFDEWLLGYFTSVPCRHNMVTFLIEMASVNVASPIFQRRSELRGSRGLDDYDRRANFPEPWQGGWWRLADIVAYEQTAIFSVARLAARTKTDWLRNFYELGTRQVERGGTEPPFAFLVPPGQSDPATAFELVATLMHSGVEVHRAKEPFVADRVEYAPGTRVILMAQPFRAHAKDLLERQAYPDLRTYPGGPPERPYDVAGWSLPLLMGVDTVQVVEPFEAVLTPVPPSATLPAGTVTRSASVRPRYLIVERAQNNAYRLVNRCLARGQAVYTAPEAVELDSFSFAQGAFAIPLDAKSAVADEARALGLRFHAVAGPDELAEPAFRALKPVRLALYQPWTASMDEGWTRWVLERFEFPYQTLHDAEVRAGGLRERYDVILLPDIRATSIIEGRAEGSVPVRYTGGIGGAGVFALVDFVRAGGTVVAIDSACELLIDKLGLPLRNTLSSKGGRSRDDRDRFFCPGSILRVDVDNTHPLAYGLAGSAAVMNVSSPVFERVAEEKAKSASRQDRPVEEPKLTFVASYPSMNPLMSGWVENDEAIRGLGALVQADFAAGGRIVLIGFRCQFRAQTHGTFKVLFNAMLEPGHD